MITFRHHVVTLVAVFLALAVGIVLGGGPLSEVGLRSADSSEKGEADAGTEQRLEATQGALGYSGQLSRALASRTADGALSERPVALVKLPGAGDRAVEQLTTAVSDAGGSVAATYSLGETLLSVGEKSLVDTLGSQLAAQVEADAVQGDASTYVRLGQLLGRAVAVDGDDAVDADGTSTAILEGLAGGELVSGAEKESRRAPLVLVVLGNEVEPEVDPIVSGLLEGLASTSRGVVAAGPTASGADGVLSRIRQQGGEVGSTVDGVEHGAGQVTTVLALAAAYGETFGHFGATGSDGVPPLG